MQSILFLRDTDDGPVTRLINIDLLSSAQPSPANPEEWTQVYCGNADITIHMPFATFVKHVEYLITENYRVAHEDAVQWHEKRSTDLEDMMRKVLADQT